MLYRETTENLIYPKTEKKPYQHLLHVVRNGLNDIFLCRTTKLFFLFILYLHPILHTFFFMILFFFRFRSFVLNWTLESHEIALFSVCRQGDVRVITLDLTT